MGEIKKGSRFYGALAGFCAPVSTLKLKNRSLFDIFSGPLKGYQEG